MSRGLRHQLPFLLIVFVAIAGAFAAEEDGRGTMTTTSAAGETELHENGGSTSYSDYGDQDVFLVEGGIWQFDADGVPHAITGPHHIVPIAGHIDDAFRTRIGGQRLDNEVKESSAADDEARQVDDDNVIVARRATDKIEKAIERYGGDIDNGGFSAHGDGKNRGDDGSDTDGWIDREENFDGSTAIAFPHVRSGQRVYVKLCRGTQAHRLCYECGDDRRGRRGDALRPGTYGRTPLEAQVRQMPVDGGIWRLHLVMPRTSSPR